MRPHEVHAKAVGRGNHDLIAEKGRFSIRTSQRWANEPVVDDYTGEAQGRHNPLDEFLAYLTWIDYARREAKDDDQRKPGAGVAEVIEFLRDYAARHFDLGQPEISREQQREALKIARRAISQALAGGEL